MTKDLYTPTEVRTVREQLAFEQNNKDALTGLTVENKQQVLDHDHGSQYVRAVLHRQVNAMLGKIENAEKRYLGSWYKGTLSDFLRQCADYLEREPDTRWYHPGWIKRITADFNKLNAKQKDLMLIRMNSVPYSCKNDTERKAEFKRILLTRTFSFDTLKNFIRLSKEN